MPSSSRAAARSLSRIATLALVTASMAAAAAGCAPIDEDGDPTGVGSEAADLRAVPHPFDIGMNEWVGEFGHFDAFRAAEGSRAGAQRLCHLYTYWNIAREGAPHGDETHTHEGLIRWLTTAESHCDEVLVTFQGKQSEPESPPSTTHFEEAFQALLHMTEPGQPLAAWHHRLSFTPWNEPNNQSPGGSGLTEPLSPEQAADYYLAIRSHCAPSDGCRVAAGDFATDGGTAYGIEWNCENDNDPNNTPTHCAAPSRFNTHDAPPSYLDRYKNRIATHAQHFGLPHGFRPEYFAYHPWREINDYIHDQHGHHQACSSYQDCSTRRLLQSLGGSWGTAQIWDDEIGAGLQSDPPADPDVMQPCAAAFLVQLTELSPRITRVYYMTFGGGRGRLFDGDVLNPAGRILAEHATQVPGVRCPATGM